MRRWATHLFLGLLASWLGALLQGAWLLGGLLAVWLLGDLLPGVSVLAECFWVLGSLVVSWLSWLSVSWAVVAVVASWAPCPLVASLAALESGRKSAASSGDKPSSVARFKPKSFGTKSFAGHGPYGTSASSGVQSMVPAQQKVVPCI